jgi:hypothetical protein
MRFKKFVVLFSSIVLLALASVTALGDSQKCGGADIANGPFTYTALSARQATFNGIGGSAVSTSFSVTAPSVDAKQQTDAPDLFPGEGANPCTATANATIGVLEIQQVGDAAGNPITPVDLDRSVGLGLQIAGAFSLTPNSHTFSVGETITVALVISNPGLGEGAYGDYDVKLAAQAPAFGIGVGDGPHFLLSLRGLTATDTTPPVVTVTKPTGDEILGVIPVEVQAYDPDTPPVATGLASMSATVSSAGGTVSGLAVPLTLDQSLPVAAGVTVTGTGTFTPTGGAPGAGPGTTDAAAFTGSSRSGIGSYTINAQAVDGAGNIGYGSKSFKVNYQVSFTKQDSTNPCQSGGNSSCTGQFKFTVNRSSITSDSAFMYDHTVEIDLVRVSDSKVVATHVYGTGPGGVLSWVQIDTTPIYQTNFRRGDIGASGPIGYVAKVYFYDVDNNRVLHATSNSVTF